MHPMRLHATAVILLVALLSAPAAAGLTLDLEDGTRLGDREAPPGDPLTIEARGDLVVDGALATSAPARPGADGPDLILRVEGTLVLADGATLRAADGHLGSDAGGLVEAIGSRGGDGGDVLVTAERIRAQGALLVAGDGAAGGDAIAVGNPHALALGGDGGDAGEIRLVGTLLGALDRHPGDGGDGGRAHATGQDGEDCTADRGASQTDNRSAAPPNLDGSGQDANATAEPGTCGPVDGQGGRGGDAEARGGQGGTAPNGTGGDGGDAYALGGRGGDGMDACFESVEAAEASGITNAGSGGHGGGAVALGGDGGPGATGGDGGFAFARTEGGDGGNATNPPIGYGDGGWNFDPFHTESRVKGGDGGPGATGGGGGDAVGRGFGGDGGGHCGPLPRQYAWEGVPGPSSGVAIGALVGACLLLAGRRRPLTRR